MGLFEGKTPAERNKIIAAIVLGVIAVATLTWAFGGMLLPSGGPATPPVTDGEPADPEGAQGTAGQDVVDVPVNLQAVNSDYVVTPVVYNGGRVDAPISGRNIFAFYEPPAFTPTPTPDPGPTYVPPTPPPRPPMPLAYVTPTTTYAGSQSFRIEAIGEDFVENARIIFSGNALPTTFISPTRLAAQVPASLIARAGGQSIMVNTPDGTLYSYPVQFNVIPPPAPDFEYIGVIARQHYNNDTAYFQDKGRRNQDPFTARLNDVVKGRFRVISISSEAVEFEDVRLGFKHRLELLRPDGPVSTSGGGLPVNRTPSRSSAPTTRIPGIPDDIPRAPNDGNRPNREALKKAIEELQKRRQNRQKQDSDNDPEIQVVELPEPPDNE